MSLGTKRSRSPNFGAPFLDFLSGANPLISAVRGAVFAFKDVVFGERTPRSKKPRTATPTSPKNTSHFDSDASILEGNKPNTVFVDIGQTSERSRLHDEEGDVGKSAVSSDFVLRGHTSRLHSLRSSFGANSHKQLHFQGETLPSTSSSANFISEGRHIDTETATNQPEPRFAAFHELNSAFEMSSDPTPAPISGQKTTSLDPQCYTIISSLESVDPELSKEVSSALGQLCSLSAKINSERENVLHAISKFLNFSSENTSPESLLKSLNPNTLSRATENSKKVSESLEKLKKKMSQLEEFNAKKLSVEDAIRNAWKSVEDAFYAPFDSEESDSKLSESTISHSKGGGSHMASTQTSPREQSETRSTTASVCDVDEVEVIGSSEEDEGTNVPSTVRIIPSSTASTTTTQHPAVQVPSQYSHPWNATMPQPHLHFRHYPKEEVPREEEEEDASEDYYEEEEYEEEYEGEEEGVEEGVEEGEEGAFSEEEENEEQFVEGMHEEEEQTSDQEVHHNNEDWDEEEEHVDEYEGEEVEEEDEEDEEEEQEQDQYQGHYSYHCQSFPHMQVFQLQVDGEEYDDEEEDVEGNAEEEVYTDSEHEMEDGGVGEERAKFSITSRVQNPPYPHTAYHTTAVASMHSNNQYSDYDSAEYSASEHDAQQEYTGYDSQVEGDEVDNEEEVLDNAESMQ